MNENVGCGDYRLGHSVHEGHGEEEDEGLHQEPVREEHLQDSLPRRAQILTFNEGMALQKVFGLDGNRIDNWQSVTTGAALR